MPAFDDVRRAYQALAVTVVPAAIWRLVRVLHQVSHAQNVDDAGNARGRSDHRLSEPAHRAGPGVSYGDARTVANPYRRGSAASRVCARVAQGKLAAAECVPEGVGAARRARERAGSHLGDGPSGCLQERWPSARSAQDRTD